MKMEIDDLMSTTEALTKAKGNYEKQNRTLDDQCSDLRGKYEESEKSISEAQASKARQLTEINELKRVLEEKETFNGQLLRSKNSIAKSNEELKRQLEEEIKVNIFG